MHGSSCRKGSCRSGGVSLLLKQRLVADLLHRLVLHVHGVGDLLANFRNKRLNFRDFSFTGVESVLYQRGV